MTTVDSLYWGCYYIASLIESFETYRLVMIFKCGSKLFFFFWIEYNWRLNLIKTERISILSNKLFQSDLMSRNVSFHSSFLSSHVWIIRHQSLNQNISLPLSLFGSTSVTYMVSIYWKYNILLKQWRRCFSFHVQCTYSTSLTETPLLIRCKPCSGCAQRCKLTWKRLIGYA